MSDHIEVNGKKYFEEDYLILANNNTKRAHERIAALTSALEDARAQLEKRGHLLDEWNEKLIALRETIARLSAPVSDEEWAVNHWIKSGGSMRSFIDGFLASRKAASKDVPHA